MTKPTFILAILATLFIGACAAETGYETDEEAELVEIREIQSELLAAGSSVRNGVGPNLLQKNWLYTLSLPQQGGSGLITDVRWTWNLSYRPAGLSVDLCRQNSTSCISVTNNQTGTTTAWMGQTSNVPFLLNFFITGSGTISPTAFGKNDQVIINYQ